MASLYQNKKKEYYYNSLKNKTSDPKDTSEKSEGLFYNLSDVLISADKFIRFIRESYNTFKKNPSDFVSLPGYTYQYASKVS